MAPRKKPSLATGPFTPAVPTNPGTASSDGWYQTWTGNKSASAGSASQIAAKVRADIARAIAQGELPATLKTQVTGSQRYVRVHILAPWDNIPLFERAYMDALERGSGDQYTRSYGASRYSTPVVEVLRALTSIVAQYQWQQRGDDMLNTNFYDEVAVSRAWESEETTAIMSGKRIPASTRFYAALGTLRMLVQQANRAGVSSPEMEAALDALVAVHHHGASPREAQSRIAALRSVRTATLASEGPIVRGRMTARRRVLTLLIDATLLLGSGIPVGRTQLNGIADALSSSYHGLPWIAEQIEGLTSPPYDPRRKESANAARIDYEQQIERGPRTNPARTGRLTIPVLRRWR